MSVPVQVFPFSWSPGYSLDWNIRFNHEVPIEMEVEAGANETHLDLSDLIVTDLRLNTGASRTMLTLPANAGYTRVSIKSGAASIDIAIPSGVEARILTRGGLSDIKIDSSRFTRSGNVYQSAGYAEAANKVDLDVEMGVGSVTVR
jgi:hypothetical protein